MGDDATFSRRIASAAAQIDPALTDEHVDQLVAGVGPRRRRRTIRRASTAVVLTGALAVAFLMVGRHGDDGMAVSAPAGALRLSDGTVATPFDGASVLAVREDSRAAVRIEVVRGGGRFDVVPGLPRLFAVVAGDVTVRVVGTVFTVEKVADRVGVGVQRGAVEVDWGSGKRQLAAGDLAWFPPLVVAPGDAAIGAHELDAAPADQPARPVPRPRVALRTPAETSRADRARQVAPAAGPDPAAELLAAADAARAAGRPEEAVVLLRRLLKEHGENPRASLAAFTLGRVLLVELDKPVEAAKVFADLRARAPGGVFAEDALAREVEAWKRAGERDTARARAEEYLRLYPNGNRTDRVKAAGGIE